MKGLIMGATLTCLRPAPPASSNQSEPIPAQSSPPSPSPPPPTEQPQPEQSSQPQQPRPVIHHQRSPSSDKDSAYRQNFLGESLASCSSGPSSASDTSSLFSTSRYIGQAHALPGVDGLYAASCTVLSGPDRQHCCVVHGCQILAISASTVNAGTTSGEPAQQGLCLVRTAV